MAYEKKGCTEAHQVGGWRHLPSVPKIDRRFGMHIIGSMTGGWLRRMLNTSEVQATPKWLSKASVAGADLDSCAGEGGWCGDAQHGAVTRPSS